MSGATARTKGRWLRWGLALLLLALVFLAKGYWNATRDPTIHTASVKVAKWPDEAEPLNVLLLSDIHVAGPDMPPERLRRLVRQFNALKPDLVLIAGDLVSEKRLATRIYTAEQVVAPLAHIRARLGVVVAPGNHDHWFDSDALRTELEAVGLTVLQNEAVLRGPLAIGGVDDDFSGHDNVPETFAALDKLPSQFRILVTHSPDIVPDLPVPVEAVFTGHTHCGQIRLPLVGAISYVSRYGDRFACGDINDSGQRVFVGAGLGTSIVPLRYGAMPDAWLVRIGP
ncbi:MAG: metallophosphoesterase [Sphingorhabdus sp.]|uniref:metallophosphoesterase n=1 Tax=Sphingorhabdus sp. TaxID=1902408 RepID=UPI003CAA6E5A